MFTPIELLLEYHDVPDVKKVKVVSQRLKGRAADWWKQLQVDRERKGREKVRKLEEDEKEAQGVLLVF